MSYSKKIGNFVNLVSAILGVEIGAVDNNMIAIAGTGKYRNNVGHKRPGKSYAEYCLTTGESVILENPRYGAHCNSCEGRNICPYSMSMYSPILNQNNLIEGAVFFLAYTNRHRQAMVQSINQYKNYLSQVSSMLSELIEGNALKMEKQRLTCKLETLINMVQEKIVVVNSEDKITHVSMAAKEVLKTRDLLGCGIADFCLEMGFGNVKARDLIRAASNPAHMEKGGMRLEIRPIIVEQEFAGRIIRIEDYLRRAFPIPNSPKLGNAFLKIIGSSRVIKEVIEQAGHAADTQSIVLLQGETGTGKELIARGIHEKSSRRYGPLVIVNCSAIPEGLLESEILGYEEGAFTGARRNGKPGKFELADKGTLFLDEVGDLGLSMQSKLLRIIEDGIVERIGGILPRKVDVRIIAATNRNLEQMVKQGLFREDFYYRINVVPINLIPLRARREDIASIASHFINQFCSAFGKPHKIPSSDVMDLFLKYSWPGNIRELRNVIEYMLNMAPGDFLTLNDLPPYLKVLSFPVERDIEKHVTHLDLLESDAIESVLQKYGISVMQKKKAADFLGISLPTLYRRIEKYNLTEYKRKHKHANQKWIGVGFTL